MSETYISPARPGVKLPMPTNGGLDGVFFCLTVNEAIILLRMLEVEREYGPLPHDAHRLTCTLGWWKRVSKREMAAIRDSLLVKGRISYDAGTLRVTHAERITASLGGDQ